jgi:hypothetical protein
MSTLSSSPHEAQASHMPKHSDGASAKCSWIMARRQRPEVEAYLQGSMKGGGGEKRECAACSDHRERGPGRAGDSLTLKHNTHTHTQMSMHADEHARTRVGGHHRGPLSSSLAPSDGHQVAAPRRLHAHDGRLPRDVGEAVEQQAAGGPPVPPGSPALLVVVFYALADGRMHLGEVSSA